jgi:flagellar biosynthesis protein FliQ
VDILGALLREALVTTAAIALPILGTAALVGTAVAVVQAATQVQEQTLTLLPKVIAVGVMTALFGELAMRLLAGLFNRALEMIPALTSAR